MPVNILVRETDKAETVVPGLRLPMERQADTFDVDSRPLPRLMKWVPQAQEPSNVYGGTLRGGSAFPVIQGLKNHAFPHHGADYVLVSNVTVALFEAKNTYIDGCVVTHSDPADAVTVYYHSLLSSTEHELLFRTPDFSSRGELSEPLADYDAYSVENWDGYDARPISSDTLHAARTILRSLPRTFGDPVCSPGADGSIVFEWLKEYGPLRKLFIDIGPGRTWKAYWRLASGKTGNVPRKRVTISTIPELQELFETLLHG
jgi:hypothetical protein